MAKYLIDGAILTEIADIIRLRSPNHWEPNRKIPPEEMGNCIDIHVADANYDLGWEEGYEEGYNNGLRTIRGSFALKGYIEDFGMYGTYPCPSGIYTNFYCDGDGDWHYDEVDNFNVGNNGVGVHSTSGLFKYVIYEDGWYDGDDTLGSGNLRLMYIDILEPVQVSQELYEVLNQIIDFGDEYTPYDVGYAVGYEDGQSSSSGDLEALGALCEWQITTDSDSWVTVNIFNYHPSFYLHCEVQLNNAPTIYKIVVPPNSSRSISDDEALRADEYIIVDNVRWKASAT